MNSPYERYHITFAFGSFVYLFFVIGAVCGFTFAALGFIGFLFSFSWADFPSAIEELIGAPFLTAISFSIWAAIGFLPYRWLAKRGLGWPTKGIYVKVEEREL